MRALVRIAKRHKKKLIFTLVVFGGGYFTMKYGVNMLVDYIVSQGASQLANNEFSVMRKHKHFLTIKQTSDDAIAELLITLNNQIKTSLPVEELLESLKKKPTVNKLEIWESLKLMSISKFLVEIYAFSLLALFLKIELNIIGAYLFIQDKNNSSSFSSFLNMDGVDETRENPAREAILSDQDQNSVLTPGIQKQYLANIENFLQIGLPNLINKVQLLCEQTFKDINLKENMSVDVLAEKFDIVRQKLESESFDLKFERKNSDRTESITIDLEKIDEIVVLPSEQTSLSNDAQGSAAEKIEEEPYLFACKYLLPDIHQTVDGRTSEPVDNQSLVVADEPVNSVKSEEEILAEMNMETYDIMSSSDCRRTFTSLVELLIGEYLNHLTSAMIQQIMSADIDPSEKITISLPFARMIPILNKLNMIESPGSDLLVEKLLNNNYLNIFSANIYEAFSFDPTTVPKPSSSGGKLPGAIKSIASVDSLMTRLLF